MMTNGWIDGIVESWNQMKFSVSRAINALRAPGLSPSFPVAANRLALFDQEPKKIKSALLTNGDRR